MVEPAAENVAPYLLYWWFDHLCKFWYIYCFTFSNITAVPSMSHQCTIWQKNHLTLANMASFCDFYLKWSKTAQIRNEGGPFFGTHPVKKEAQKSSPNIRGSSQINTQSWKMTQFRIYIGSECKNWFQLPNRAKCDNWPRRCDRRRGLHQTLHCFERRSHQFAFVAGKLHYWMEM